MNLLFVELTFQQIGIIVAMTLGLMTLMSLFAVGVWSMFRKQANAQWQEVVASQREKINLLTTDVASLRIENGELKAEVASLERRLKRIEEREEELEKDNRRLKALVGEH